MPRVAATEREAYVERRREEILQAALRLFSEKGFDQTSVDALARQVGVSKGTIYLYFPTKLAILDELLQRYSLLPAVEDVLGRLRDWPLEQVVPQLVRVAWGVLQARKDLIRVLFREMPTHLERSHYFLERVVLPINRLFADYLAHKLGPQRAAEISTLVAGRSLFGMVLVFFVSQEILGGAELLPIPEEEIAQTISEVYLHGVVGRGGAA